MKPMTKAWLDRALDDLNTIERLLGIDYLTNMVAFHAQQAVEKSLKAVMEEVEIDFVKTHDLVKLYGLVQPYYDLVEDMDVLERIDAVYTESRYPNEMGLLPYSKPSIAESTRFYQFAKQLYQQVTVTLEPEQEK